MSKHLLRLFSGIFFYFASLIFLGVFGFILVTLIQSHRRVIGDVIFALIILPLTSVGCIWYGTKMIWKSRKIDSENSMTFHECGYPYTGFNRRALARLIDFLILLPLITMGFIFQYKSKTVYLISDIGMFVVVLGYQLIFNAIRGQTPGKMITRIKILRTDGKMIGFKEAILRVSMDCSLNLIDLAWRVSSMWTISNQEFINWGEKALQINNPVPGWVNIFYCIWSLIDILVFLVNRQNRAAHDLIAGTVVLQVDKSQA